MPGTKFYDLRGDSETNSERTKKEINDVLCDNRKNETRFKPHNSQAYVTITRGCLASVLVTSPPPPSTASVVWKSSDALASRPE
jgi:hypothetical protein